MQVSLQLLATAIMETLAVWILRICVYIIFIVQVIYSTVLIILGPFSVAMSILPAFRDSFSTWIARFISVNLYAGIAYLVMRSEEHTSELQSLMRISYAVFCLKKKKQQNTNKI